MTVTTLPENEVDALQDASSVEGREATPSKVAKRKKDPDGLTKEDFPPRDFALEVLLGLTVDLSVDNAIGMSVVSSGMLISGIAIHRKKWLELLVAQIKDAGKDGNTVPLANAVDTIVGKGFADYEAMRDRRAEQDLDVPPVHYIHFRDARVHTSQYTDYPLFRVAIDDISAWSLGSHSEDAS